MLLAVILMATMMAVALTAGTLSMQQQIKRDREEELVHRAKQYVRAIRLYYRKFGYYPANLDQLENVNNLRFLRKRFPDPITGKADWHLIHQGEAMVNGQQPINGASTPGASATPTPQNTGMNQPNQSGTNQTFGGGGIIGVSSSSTAVGIKEFNKKKKYNEWQFYYDPSQEIMSVPGQNGQTPTNNINMPNQIQGFGNNGTPMPNPTP